MDEIPNKAPAKRLAILGCGPSSLDYFPMAECMGDRAAKYDAVWAVNSFGSVAQCDMIFHMDDLKVQEIRAAGTTEWSPKLATMLGYFKKTNIPIMTSRAYPEYPTSQAFPLDAIVNKMGTFYFTSTPAYAVAYGLYQGFKEISLFGMDYTWPNSSQAEEGRACIEFWIGMGMAHKVVFNIAQSSTLMCTREPLQHKLYGYDSQELVRIVGEDNKVKLEFKDKEVLPTAEEMRAKYNHDLPSAA